MLFRLISDWIGNRRDPGSDMLEASPRPEATEVTRHLEEAKRLEASGLCDEAERRYRALLATHPSHPYVLFSIGKLLARGGKFDDAIDFLRLALTHDAGLREAQIVLANVFLMKKQFTEAKQLYEAVHAHESTDAGLLNNYGLALHGLHEYPRAKAILEKAISASPNSIEALTNLGLVFLSEKNRDDAENHFRTAFALDAGHSATVQHLCNLLLQAGRAGEAVEIAEQSLRINPSLVEAHRMAGYARFEIGDFSQAELHLRKVIETFEDTEGLTYLARTLQSLGRNAEALGLYDRALSLDARNVHAAWHRSLLLLQTGNYSQGWNDYELRLLSEDPSPRHLPLRRWDGEPSRDGHLLVYAEQGLGDQIMFCSCLPDALTRAHRCTIECASKLEPLLRRSFPRCDIIGTNYEAPENWIARVTEPTMSIPMGSLPRIFRRRAEDFPARGGYLVADPAKIDRWKQLLSALGPEPKIGISWVGGSVHSRQNLRSIPLAQWEPILTTPGFKFISLQYTPCQLELAEVEECLGVPVHHWPEAIEDYDETAALVCALDLVISVQTAVIHLCGALGRPAWVLVPVCAEWRYGSTTDTMDWYPSLRLFRQAQLGDWRTVLERVGSELALHVTHQDDRSTQ